MFKMKWDIAMMRLIPFLMVILMLIGILIKEIIKEVYLAFFIENVSY